MRYSDCIRVIRMNLYDSLYDLHRMIQKAVAFDDDHLFEFTVGSGMMKRSYTMSDAMSSEGGLPVEETRLGDLELRRGQNFTYLFDFGDSWWFDIKVLEIRDGMVEEPEVIKAVNAAPEQYPDYEEDMEEWQVEISDSVRISDILSSIEDDLIRDEYAALTGIKSGVSKESPAFMRQGMERILLENPDRMLTFMTKEMREKLAELLRQEWIDVSERCTLAMLYAFGFCRLPEEGEYEISVPGPIKEIYLPKLKTAGKKDKIAEAAEVFLRRCGVMEMQCLYADVTKFLKRKIARDDFDFLVYSRLSYFGAYYSDRYQDTEYMSCYDREMTQKILAERLKPENAAFDYPDFGELYSGKLKELPEALKNWIEYVRFNLNIDWLTSMSLAEQIPIMAVSGILGKEEIVAEYKEMLRGSGSRVTKKAEDLIGKLCTSMPLATKKGNIVQEDYSTKPNAAGSGIKTQNTDSRKGSVERQSVKEEFQQMSIFDL